MKNPSSVTTKKAKKAETATGRVHVNKDLQVTYPDGLVATTNYEKACSSVSGDPDQDKRAVMLLATALASCA